ncbi:V-set and transmembrane domain-containing protein 5 [Talpa occidentalis]|uniref:V-set and transmembrane domain-containing protein 5 n=1 Tax=Talpa occidentalis TaxID=50954 RepID=UPI0023F959D5|nr:V-set and transmembrane domain-containing protein 5 [Talpa occidentalis]
MRRPPRALALGLVALCLAQAARPPHGPGVSLYIPQPAINASAAEDVLLSVDYACEGVPTIEWRHASPRGQRTVAAWAPGGPANVSRSHRGRVCTFPNGSLQLLGVGVPDAGYYVVTVTERRGGSRFGTIALQVSEVLYEDLHFVAVFLALLAAVAAVLVSLLWVCNRCAYKLRAGRRRALKESAVEVLELQDVDC